MHSQGATIIDAVRARLRALANPAKAPDMRAYMKSTMPFLGVQKPARDALARELFGAPLSFDDWGDTVLRLWREATYREECGWTPSRSNATARPTS